MHSARFPQLDQLKRGAGTRSTRALSAADVFAEAATGGRWRAMSSDATAVDRESVTESSDAMASTASAAA